MKAVTTSQPQFYPPLYIMSRFAHADVTVVLSMTQHRPKEFMSDFFLWDAFRGVKEGIRLPTEKQGRPWCSLVSVGDTKEFVGYVESRIRSLYKDCQYVDDAVMLFRETFKPSESLVETTMNTLEALYGFLGLPINMMLDTQLNAERLKNPSEWIAEIANEVGAAIYFQGGDSMNTYLEADKFHGMKLASQVYEGPPGKESSKLSVLHWVATRGIGWVSVECSGEKTGLRPFTGGVR